MNVSVIIPARNEQENIGKMVRMILALYHEFVNEIIVVDDGSTDDTKSIVADIAGKDRRVKLIGRHPPHGVGLALRKGLEHVSKNADYVFTLDADFIRNIPDLEDFFLNIKNYDGIVGSRYLERYSLIRYPLLKRFANRTFHLLVRLFLGIKHTDLTNNFKLYKRKIFAHVPLTSHDYAINAETGIYPILLGYKIKELPVIWYARGRAMGSSKFHLLQVAPSYVKVLLKAMKIRALLLSKRTGKRSD